MPLLSRTSRTWDSEDLCYSSPMLPYYYFENNTSDHTGTANNGLEGSDHYVVDRDDRRVPRPEDRSHFFNFGALFSPNQAGRNCLPAVSWTAQRE